MRTFFMILLGVLFVPVGANAAVVEFTDTTIYMPTWESRDQSDNYKDTINSPDFQGGRLFIEDKKLTGVQFDYTKNYWTSGDVFIDKDNNGYFDYVLNNRSNTIFGFEDHVLSSTKGANDHLFLTSNQLQNNWYGHEYREDHFVALNISHVNELIGDGQAQRLGSFNAGHHNGGWYDPSAYIFDGFSLDLAAQGEFSLVFSPTCANDVIAHTATVPLPGTFVLLSAGLFGLMGARRKMQER